MKTVAKAVGAPGAPAAQAPEASFAAATSPEASAGAVCATAGNAEPAAAASYPEVDIVVTAHNMESCLSDCLQSLAAQTFANFRVLVVVDGCSDGTEAVATSFAERDVRFSFVATPGLGAGGARNRGLDWAQAPYFMVLDGDDVFHPDMLAKLYAAAVDGRADVAVCDMQEFDDVFGERTRVAWALKRSQLPSAAAFDGWRAMPGNIFAAFMGWPWDKLYRTEFVRGAGVRFPEDLPNSEDMLFVYPLLVEAQRIAVVPEVLIDHRMGRGDTVSSSRVREPYAFYEAICRMKAFLMERSKAWKGLQKDFLNWAFDWTLWNIETIGDAAVAREMTQRLHDGGFPALGLSEHEAKYFTGYPRSMARYATLMNSLGADERNNGPLGSCRDLPYGKYRCWDDMNYAQKALAVLRDKIHGPSEW